jgi:hypothetical protein
VRKGKNRNGEIAFQRVDTGHQKAQAEAVVNE